MKSRLDWLAALAVAGIWIWYVVQRLFAIPMTIDEVATCINHVPRLASEIITYSKDPVPNNHVLNTLLIKIFAGMFDMNTFTARLPALLGGIAYLFASWKLARLFSGDSLVRLFTIVLLLGNPFMTEFFSLARGYGLSVGLLLLAIYFAWQYQLDGTEKDAKRGMWAAGLSVIASFTALNFFPVYFVVLLWLVKEKTADWRAFWPKARPLGILFAAFILLSYMPISRMQSNDEFRFWGNSSFWRETLIPFTSASARKAIYLGENGVQALAGILAVVSVLGILIGGFLFFRRKMRIGQDSFVFGSLLLGGTLLLNVLQHYLLNVPFLNARTALLFHPLFALMLAGAAAQIARHWGRRVVYYVVPLMLFTVFNFARAANLDESFEWYFDKHTYKVLNYLKDIHEKEGLKEPIILDCNSSLQNSLEFHTHTAANNYGQWVRMVPWHGGQDPAMNTEFYFTSEAREIDFLRERGYEDVLPSGTGGMVLMRKKRQ